MDALRERLTVLDPHWAHERTIFLRFLRTVPALGVLPESIRRGDGYDIACTTNVGDALAFELTEITDANWASIITSMVSAAKLMNDRLKEAHDQSTQTIRTRYWERDIAVKLAPGTGARTLRRLLDPLFTWLASVDPDAVGAMATPAELSSVILQVEARYFPGIKGLCFHVPGDAAWIGDVSVPAIRAKFGKDYPSGIGLQLLAYFHRQPVRPDAVVNVRGYLEAVMPDEVFSTVWLYDDLGRNLLLRYP